MSASSRRLSAIYRQCDPARDGRPPRPPPPSSSVAASGCRQPPVIKQVVAQILRLPEVDGSKGDSGQDTLLVRIVTECGLVGFGEVEAQPEVAKAIIDAPRSWGGKKIGASGLSSSSARTPWTTSGCGTRCTPHHPSTAGTPL
jgi:hypothetical protein